MTDQFWDAVGKLTEFVQKMQEDDSASCGECPAEMFCAAYWQDYKACHAVLKAWVKEKS